MKRNTIFLLLMLVISTTTFAQNNVTKWITDKCSAMKDQIKIDLQLSSEDADTYHQILFDKITTDVEKVKTMTTDEEKKAYYSGESFKNFMTALNKAFGSERAQIFKKWTVENQAKYNKVQSK